MSRSLGTGIGVTHLIPGRTTAAFDPASLFASGEEGAIYDFTDLTTTWQDTGATSQADAINDTMERVDDQSGNGNNLTRNAGTVTLDGFPATIGSQLVTSPEFEDAGDWTAGTGWSIATQTATKTAGTLASISQAISLSSGTPYLVHFCLRTRTAGTIRPKFTGGTTVQAETTYNAAGDYFEVMTAKTGNTTIEIEGDASFAGTVTIVGVYPITEWAMIGARFIGDGRLRTASSVDMSSSNAMTVIASGKRVNGITGNQYFGQIAQAATTGPRIRLENTSGRSNQISDGTTTDTVTATGLILSGVETRCGWTQLGILDTDEAAIADQSRLRIDESAPSVTHSSGDLSTAALSATTQFAFGTWLNSSTFYRGLLKRAIVINRTLTASEITNVETWCSDGMPRIGVVGDSTYDEASPAKGAGIINTERTAHMIGSALSGADVAFWGDDSEEQLVDWAALSSGVKSALDCVIVGVGHNDVRGKLDSLITGGDSYAVAYAARAAEFQELINAINADVSASCKVIGVQLIPCKVWLDGAANAADCYQAWQDWNEDLSDGTFTGLDAVVSGHVAIMNDGSDAMKTIYNSQGDGIHPNALGRWVMGQEIRKVMRTLGLVNAVTTF